MSGHCWPSPVLFSEPNKKAKTFVRNQKQKRQENNTTLKVMQGEKILKDSKYTHFVHTYIKVTFPQQAQGATVRTPEPSARQPLRSDLHNVWEQRAARTENKPPNA